MMAPVVSPSINSDLRTAPVSGRGPKLASPNHFRSHHFPWFGSLRLCPFDSFVSCINVDLRTDDHRAGHNILDIFDACQEKPERQGKNTLLVRAPGCITKVVRVYRAIQAITEWTRTKTEWTETNGSTALGTTSVGFKDATVLFQKFLQFSVCVRPICLCPCSNC